MQALKRLLNKHTLALASNAVMPVVGMVTVSLLARNLSAPDFGNWIFFLITFTLANLFRSGFLQTSLIKFYSGADKETANNVAGSTWYIAFGITAMLGLFSLVACFVYHSEPATEATIKWFGIIFFSTLPSSLALWILQAEERFDRIFIQQIVAQGCFLVSIIILIVIHQAFFQIVIYAYFISATLTSLFSVLTGWSKITSVAYKSKERIIQLFNFGKYSVATSISSYLLRGSDTFIIKFMFANPSFVGIYYLPQRLMEVIEIPLRSFIATAFPTMAAAISHGDKTTMTDTMKKYAGILTILLIPVTIIAFITADIIIEIIGGQKFMSSNAANIFRIFMCFAVLLPVDRFFGISLDVLNLPKKNMIKVVLMLIVNILGDFIGIYFFHSLYAVAVASIFTFVAGVFYGYWVLTKHLNFTLVDIIKIGFTETIMIIKGMVNKLKSKTTGN